MFGILPNFKSVKIRFDYRRKTRREQEGFSDDRCIFIGSGGKSERPESTHGRSYWPEWILKISKKTKP